MVLFRRLLILLCLSLCLGVCSVQAAVSFRGASSAAVYQPTAAYVGASAASSAASGNLAPAVAAERNAVLICVVTQHDNVAIAFPAAWTQLYSVSQSSSLRASAYYKVSDDTETAPTVTHAGGNAIIARCYRVRGVDGQNLMDVAYAAQYAASSATVSTGNVTTLTAGDLMLYVAHMARSASTTVAAAPSGTGAVTWTSRAISPTALGSGATVGLYTGVKSTAAAVGPISATLSVAGENYGGLLALHNGTTMTIALPTGTSANDVMLAAVTVTPASATATAPAGWTSITSTTNGTKLRMTTYYKVAGANEPASYVWTLSSAHTGVAGAISSYYGVNTTNPIESSAAQTTASSASHAAPSVNTTVGNGMLVTVHSYASSIYSTSSTYAGAWAPPAGMAEVVDQRSRGASSSSGVALEVNNLSLGPAGATGINTASTPASTSTQKDVGATASIALRATNALDHLEIDYPQGTLSSCAATPVTITACASTGTTCTSLYTGGVGGMVLTPGGGSLSIPAGSASVTGSVSQTAGSGTLAASSTALNATTCKNLSTSAFGCGVTFAPTVVTLSIPNFVSGKSVATSLTACTVPNGLNAVAFYSGYVDPATGTKTVSVAPQTAGVCGSFTPVSAIPGTPTPVTLSFASNTAPLCINYPDVGRVKLVPTLGSATTSSFFTVVPDHFVVSGVSCVSGCKVTTNPAATNASGAAFMKSGSPFVVTVSAYNGASPAAVTPNFGKESAPASVTLTPVLAMPDLPTGGVGNLTCSTASGTCANSVGGAVVLGGFGAATAGVASNNLSYDEVGILTLSPSLYDPAGLGYMSIGTAALNPVGTSSGTIGRFIPDHFSVVKDALSPILTQTDFLPKVTALATGTSASTNTIDIDDSSGFVVGAKIRITGGGAGGNAMTAKVTSLAATTLTLDTSTSTSLSSGDVVLQEWGSYMGEPFSLQFTLIAQDTNNNQTQNYQGVYAKLDPTYYDSNAKTWSLQFAAVSGATNLTTRIAAVMTSPSNISPVTGSFTSSGASIVAPLSISQVTSPDGPYTALMLGIAPVDIDGVAMGTFDMSVGGSSNHTSIMDPTVQASTELRYGRTKISNAYGSEQLALLVPIAIQYWNGTGYVTSSDDAATSLTASNISLSASLGSLNSASGTSATGTCQPTPLPSTLTLTNAAGKFCLLKPGVSGTMTLRAIAPSYLLPGVNGMAKFGVYKSPLLYQRENY
jgi:hypothetical protein